MEKEISLSEIDGINLENPEQIHITKIEHPDGTVETLVDVYKADKLEVFGDD